jgi:hypothetical protein
MKIDLSRQNEVHTDAKQSQISSFSIDNQGLFEKQTQFRPKKLSEAKSTATQADKVDLNISLIFIEVGNYETKLFLSNCLD